MAHRTQPESGSPITRLEQEAMTAVDRALAPAVREASRLVTQPLQIIRRNASVVNRLREANAPIIDTIVTASRDAVNMGVDDAVEEAPPPDTPEGQAQAAAAHFNPHADDSTLDRLTADMNVSGDVRALTNRAQAVASTDTRGMLIGGTVRDINLAAVQLVRTKLIGAYNRGRRWYAGLFAYELEWVTVGDSRVCPICDPLNSQTIATTKAFTSERADFQDVPGQPPAHPRCRCYTKVVRP